MITLVFHLWFSRYNRIWHWNCIIFFMLCFNTCYDGRFFPVTSSWLCTETVLFGGGFALFLPQLKCLIPNFPLSFSDHYVLMVCEVTMPAFLGQTLTSAFKLSYFSRENQNQEQRFFQSHQQVKRIKPHSQGSYPRHTGINGILPIECSGSWIQFCIPVTLVRVFMQGQGFGFENYNDLKARR